MKFYFAGAIRGGRDKVNTYIKINELLKKYGTVLDEHVANPNVNNMEKDFSLEEIYKRDINWIKECDIVVAEISVPSLGVGYELSYAERIGKPVICFYESGCRVSAMIGGNKYFKVFEYSDDNELLAKIENELKNI